MEDNVYRIYALSYPGEEVNRKLIGRLAVHGGVIHHLEDHHGVLHHIVPSGVSSERALTNLEKLKDNPYYEVLSESDVDEGKHPHEIEELDVGEVEPEAMFTLAGEGIPEPVLVEIYADAILMGGKKLNEKEAHELMQKINEGKYILTPIEK